MAVGTHGIYRGPGIAMLHLFAIPVSMDDPTGCRRSSEKYKGLNCDLMMLTVLLHSKQALETSTKLIIVAMDTMVRIEGLG